MTMDKFHEILQLLKNPSVSVTFKVGKDDVARGDKFLLFNGNEKKEITVGWRGGLVWVFFPFDHPRLLENCPESFYDTILLNAPRPE